MNDISFIILTYNEEKHLKRCLTSLLPFAKQLIVVDSFSTDDTCNIAKELGAIVYQHPFKNQALQFNWALENCEINSEWIWRVDADEYISKASGEIVVRAINTCSDDVNGISINKRIVFMGHPLKYGGWYPAPQIKIIRKGFGMSENKCMDEHLIVSSGRTIYVNADQIDENLNDLSWWSRKHIGYAEREAVNMLMMQYGLDNSEKGISPKLLGNNAERKRWLKLKYVKSPLFLRPFLNFFIRYILKGGFLDGKEGFVWHVLQGFWYRFLVDAKIFELKKKFGFDKERIVDYIKKEYGL